MIYYFDHSNNINHSGNWKELPPDRQTIESLSGYWVQIALK